MSNKRAQWTKWMRTWERSGQTRTAFCRSRGLNLPTFDYWRRVLRATSTELVPVVVAGSSQVTPAIEVVLPDGICVRVPAGCDVAQVGALVSVLRAC